MRFFFFLAFPALELYLLVKVGAVIGALNMVLWVFVSAAAGLWAVRAQGQDAMRKVRSELEQGRVPRNIFLEGLLIFLGGILLILPGLLSDALGLLLLLPPVRHLAVFPLAQWLAARQTGTGGAGGASRFVFFRSSGFSRSGEPFSPDGARGVTFQRTYVSGGSFVRPAREEFDDGSPRQAIVMDSSPVETAGNGPDREGGRVASPDGGESWSAAAPDSSGNKKPDDGDRAI